MKKFVLVLMAVLCVSIVINVWQCSRHPEESTVVKHDTVWKDTTIYQPQAAETINTGRVVYVRIPTAKPSDAVRDTIHDSIEVPVPIVQKRYEDSLYTAWVSGFEPTLDSIRLHLSEVHTTITKTIVKKSSLVTFGIQAGGGYGIFNKKSDVYVGLGVQLNLWRK
jgi:hypothetical protein